MGNEEKGGCLGIGRVRALSLLSRVRAGAGPVDGVMCRTWWRRGLFSAARLGGLSEWGPRQLRDVWVCLLEAFEGAEEKSLDAGHVLICEVAVGLVVSVWARRQQGHDAGCYHVLAELYGGGAWGGGSCAVQAGIFLLGP